MAERRKERRFSHQTPVLIRHQQGRKWYNGSMFNYSRKGMYIETDFNGRRGEQIAIMVQQPPNSSGPYLHRASIRWAEELTDAVVFYRHGCGMDCDMTVDYSLNRSAMPIQIRSEADRRSGLDRRKGPARRRRDSLAGAD